MKPTQDQAPTQAPDDMSTQPVQSAPASKSKRGFFVAGGVVAVAAVAITVGFVALGGDDTPEAPADQLAAAVDNTFREPMKVTSVQDGIESTAQIDHSNKVVLTDSPAGGQTGPASTSFLHDTDLFIKFAQDSDGVEAGQWYRVPVADSGMGSMMAIAFDPEFVASLLGTAKNVEEAEPETIDGVDTTHYVVTMDKQAVVDLTLGAMRGEGDAPMPEEARAGMAAMFPDTTEYWVDESGRLVQEDDGRQVKRYHDFGVPLDLPEIDESTVEDMPFS